MFARLLLLFSLTTFFFWGLPENGFGQAVKIQPYLQNATPSGMYVMWETDVNTESIVEYGLTPSLGNTVTGSAITTPGGFILHTTQIKGLSPGTKYYYKAKTGAWQSGIFDFITPPLRNSEAPFNIVLMSDMQKDGGNPNIFSNLINTSLLPYIDTAYGSPLSEHLQMAVIPGDVVDNGNSYTQWKNDLFDPGQALWRSVPSYPAIGNHEANSVNYFNYYNLPENGTPGYLEHWYYTDYSNVRVISLNTNSGYRIQTQLDWLDSILTLSCADTLIDFVFAEMHHPYKSELWIPGEADYTGQIVERMEAFSDTCGKPTIHFFGHTHAYSRGQSRDHNHLWVNVATSGGNIDYWGEFENQDYEEFIISEDEYGFVIVEVTAGEDPKFVMKRLSFGDQYNPGGATQTDMVAIRMNNAPPLKPTALFPKAQDTVSAFCVTLAADGYVDADNDQHGASHWQISTDSSNFSNPMHESWKQYANWYDEVNLQASDNLTDEQFNNLSGNQTSWWRVRYRDKGLMWSPWSTPQRFITSGLDTLTGNLVSNIGAENGVDGWTATTGVIESVTAGECDGIDPYTGLKYFAVGGICVNHPFASAYQDVDVSAHASAIDEGAVLSHAGAYMADWQNTDRPAMALLFLNAANTVIGSTDTISHMQSAWTLKQMTDTVPPGTRTIRVNLMGTRTAGADNDSYIDSVFCRLISGNFTCSTYAPPGPLNDRVYVDKNAQAVPDGRDWLTAFRTLGDALLYSATDTTIREVWIADGVYTVTSNGERDSSFVFERGMRVYGGFNGSESSISQRNIPVFPAILSGETGDMALNTDNVYHVIRIENCTDTLLLDGISIMDGYAELPPDTTGAGILVQGGIPYPIILRHCTLSDLYALSGSALQNASQVYMDSCNIHDNVTAGASSAILNKGGNAILTLSNTVITQLCNPCPEVIHNEAGATLTIRENVILEKED